MSQSGVGQTVHWMSGAKNYGEQYRDYSEMSSEYLSTGLAQQMQSMRSRSARPSMTAGSQPQQTQSQPISGGALGAGLRPEGPVGGGGGQPPSLPQGFGNLSELANRLAMSYGIDLGGEPLVDARGNFTRAPRTEEEALAFNRISQAVSNELNRQYEAKAVAALQTQAGMVQQRGRGSLATLQQGTYAQMAQIYATTDVSAGTFDDYIAYYQGQRAERIAGKMVKAAKYKMYGDIAFAVGNILG